MLGLLLAGTLVYLFLQVVFEIFYHKRSRQWALLSIVVFLSWVGYRSDGVQGVIGFAPMSLILLWFFYMDFREK